MFEPCHTIKGFVTFFRVVVFPAFCSQDTNTHFVVSAFTSRPTSLLATKNASVFLFTVCMPSPNKLSSPAKTRIWRVPFDVSTESQELIPLCPYTLLGRDSVVCTATRYWLDGPGIISRWGRGFPHPSRPFLGAHLACYTMVTESLSGGTAAGMWRKPSTPVWRRC